MPEYRIEIDSLTKSHLMRFRLLSWGAVLLLIAVTVLLFVLRINGLLSADSGLRWLAMLTMLTAVIATFIMAIREAQRCAEREMVFVLDDNGITRRRQGFPDVKIAFSEVDTLGEEMRWLVVKSIEPRRRIAIPNDVKGFEVLRAELAAHHALAPHVRSPLKSVVPITVSVLSWAAVLWFSDLRVVTLAGVVALTLLALGSRRLWTLFRRSEKRWVSLLWLGIVWLIAILLIYFRAVRS